MMSAQRRREDQYQVDAGFEVPDLGDLVLAGGGIERVTLTFDTVYYDTDETDLLRNRVTVQRRGGGPDTGWQVTVPGDKARTELRLPLGDDEAVPDELVAAVSGIALGKPVHLIAEVSTVRHVQRLLGSDGTVLAEVADDSASATATAGAADGPGALASQWRQVSATIGAGSDETLLRAIGEHLTRADARRSPSRSALDRALSPDDRVSGTTKEDAPVSRVLTDYLDAQVEAIVAGDVWLRRGLDPIHSTRVGIRRFRSTLRVFKGLFEPGERTRIDHELSWYAGLLGEVRDRQVQRERFARAVAELPVELVMGPVAARIENDLSAEQHRHLDTVTATLVSVRYRELVAGLARWRTAPPFADEATVDGRSIKRAARKARRKAKKRLATAVAAADDDALHRARKAAKRARYAAELAAPVIGKKKAKKKVKKYKKIQRVLGEHQDSVVATGTLHLLGARAGTTPGENGFAFGLLYALEQQAADQALADAARLVT